MVTLYMKSLCLFWGEKSSLEWADNLASEKRAGQLTLSIFPIDNFSPWVYPTKGMEWHFFAK